MHISSVALAAVVVGALFVAIGVAAATAALSTRPRVNRSAAWFAVFCGLYGLRLLAGSELIRAATSWPEVVFRYVDADVTYTILIPATLFLESLVGPGRYALLRRTWQGLTVWAASAILTDLIAGRPYVTIRVNTLMVLCTMTIWFGHLAARSRQGRWSVETRGVTIAAAILALTATYETLSDGRLFGGIDAEPLAMLLFSTALGWFVLVRARQQAFGYAALSRELELARTIQRSLLPQRFPEVPGLRMTATYLPMSAVAGDFYDMIPLPGDRLLVIVADVSGHGVPAALIASMVKVAVAAEADRRDTPGEILTGMNRALTGKFERAYVTACCIVIDPRQRIVAYALAGHPPPLLRRANGEVSPLDRGGIVLTLMPDVVYDTTVVAFEPGDCLLAYTDGLTEAERLDGDEFFGEAELARVIIATSEPKDLMHAVTVAHRRWIGPDTPVSDDISIVAIEHLDEPRR